MTFSLPRFCRHILFFSRRDQLEIELAEEIKFHRALTQNDPAMGNITIAREESREIWGFMSIEHLWQDLKYSVRTLRRSPGFTALAGLSLALGIGGNAAMFSLVNALLIRPLPFHQPERLIRITSIYPVAGLVLFQQRCRAMDVASVGTDTEYNLTGQGEAVRLTGSMTSTNLFSVLGVPVEIGRAFEPGEDRPGKDNVVVLSHALWTTRFAGDPQVVGRVITLNGVDRVVVGVMPATFSFPSARVQLWMPKRVDPSRVETYYGEVDGTFSPLIARLREGATPAQAQGEVRAITAELDSQFPWPMPRNWNMDARVISLQEDIVGDVKRKLLVLLASVGIVLLVACTNVASLLLARASSRRKEIALRASLGAGRFRIVRQLLTESVVLALAGGAAGLLMAFAALSVFRSVLPIDLPGLAEVRIDGNVAAFVAVLTLATGLAFGIAPALSASQIDLAQTIRGGGQRATRGFWARFRGWLIAAEVTFTVVLLVGAGLLTRSLRALADVNPGFNPEHIMTVRISPNQSFCRERARCIALYNDLLDRTRRIPGVLDAAVANTVPLDGKFPALPMDMQDYPRTAESPSAMFWAGAVSADYLSLMHIPVLAGRGFTDADSVASTGVVLISQDTARRFWPNESPIGKLLRPAGNNQWRTIVGIVGDVRQSGLAGRIPPGIGGTMYMPYAQSAFAYNELPAAMNLLVRATGDPARVAQEIRALAVQQNPNVPVSKVETMDSIVSGSISSFRSTMGVLLGFALTALVLAAIGIYGLVSHSVVQRTYEIGVRMALGASKPSIVGLILGQSLRFVAGGVVAGAGAAIVFARFLSSLLYGVAATDPATFAGVILFLFGIAAIASCAPAWRAAQMDPLKSLRVD
ncbi:MAG: ABC transporter permease [Bryobacteraceae bacterium]|jgi:predicted permease